MAIEEMKSSSSAPANVNETKKNKTNFPDGATIMVLSGIALVTASIITSAITKKRARQYLASHGHKLVELPESGTALALKALCYSTVITVGIFSVSIFGACKWFNINSMDDLRTKLSIPKALPNPGDRTEFESVSDFLNYVNDRYSKPKEPVQSDVA